MEKLTLYGKKTLKINVEWALYGIIQSTKSI